MPLMSAPPSISARTRPNAPDNLLLLGDTNVTQINVCPQPNEQGNSLCLTPGTALKSAVWPVRETPLTFAFKRASSSIIAKWPLYAAKIRSVAPMQLVWSISAPLCTVTKICIPLIASLQRSRSPLVQN